MADLTYQDILNILRVIDSGEFENLEVEYEGTKIKVRRKSGQQAAGAVAVKVPVVMRAPEPPKAPVTTPAGNAAKVALKQQAPAQQAAATDVKNGVAVKAPMAGTFYSAPSPGAAPFVEVNRTVKKDDQLGIVEVMKLFTAVVAPCAGTVRVIHVKNEEFVQSEQALITIEPSGK